MVVFGLAVALGIIFFLHRDVGGMRPNYPAKDFDPLLTSKARPAHGLIAALEAYRRDHSHYPGGVHELASYLGDRTPAEDLERICGCTYVCDGDTGYHLYFKLGWDPSLNYVVEGTKGQWIFDPGDGSPTKEIQLKP